MTKNRRICFQKETFIATLLIGTFLPNLLCSAEESGKLSVHLSDRKGVVRAATPAPTPSNVADSKRKDAQKRSPTIKPASKIVVESKSQEPKITQPLSKASASLVSVATSYNFADRDFEEESKIELIDRDLPDQSKLLPTPLEVEISDLEESNDSQTPTQGLSPLKHPGTYAEPSKPGPRCGRYCVPGCERAGEPHCLGLFAKCFPGSEYSVGYVGGGTFSFCGEPRTTEEGTYGLDYHGSWFSRKVWMRWSHGVRHQGGEGAYKTDGPKLFE